MEGSAKDRLDMLLSSITGDPRLTVDDCELKREGISYTIDTLTDIIRRYRPDGKPALIIGDDLAPDFPNWNKAGEILSLADIIIARRVHSGDEKYPYPNMQIKNEVMELSSALVRERIHAGKAWRYLVPPGAGAVILERGLYGISAEALREPIFRIETCIRSGLSSGRFLHSRNTALLAGDLCLRFGLDPARGYLAGLAHDMGKQLDEKELLRLAKTDGKEISGLQRKKPSLLHGRAAAVLLKERFDIHNEDVLEAVAFHTEGRAGMGPLAKAVYIADKIEVSRKDVDPALRELAFHPPDGDNLDLVFNTVFNATVTWLKSRELDLSEGTMRLLEHIQKRDGGEKKQS
jgi:nicotinate-nucleotide adenylyltransferase